MSRWHFAALTSVLVILTWVGSTDAQPDGIESKVAHLVRLLRSSDEAERVRASWQIGNLGESAATAVPALVANLSDPSRPVRLAAYMALGRLGAAAAPAVSVLREMLIRCDSDEVAYPITALGDLSASIPEARTAFLELLDDESEDIRWYAVAWLAERPLSTTAVVPKLIRCLAPSEGAIMRWNAAKALTFYGSASAPAVGSLSECLNAEVDELRCSAALALAAIGAPAADAVPALKRAASASAAEVKASSLFAIWRVTGEESGAAAALSAALTGTIWEVSLLEALGQMGSLATPHVGMITERLGSEEAWVREAAARALGRVPSESGAAATALSEALADPSSAVRAAATTSLAAIAAGRDEEFRECIEGLRSPDAGLREGSAKRVPLLGADAKYALGPLLGALGDESPDVRAAAARALGSFGEGGALAIPALARALASDDLFVRRDAGRALCLRSPNDPAAFGVLGAALERGDELTCYGAIFGLRALAPVAARFAPALARIVDSGGPWLRLEAIRTIATIGPGARQTEPSLVRTLSGDDGEAALEATWALVSLGSASPAAIEALETVSRRESPELRAACALALFGAKRLDRRMLDANLEQTLPKMQDPLRCLRAVRRLGSAAADLVPVVASLMQHGDHSVQREVLMTLAAIGRDVPATRTAIVTGLHSEHAGVRSCAARTLRQYVHERRWALGLLLPLLEDADFAVGLAATVSLASFGRSLEGVIPELTRVLGWGCPDPLQAIILLRVLGSLGSRAATAIPTLEEIAASDTESPEVRKAARAALGCISRDLEHK